MAKKAPTDRTIRIAEQIKKDVSILIARELRDPRVGMVTIQDVQLTADYAHAKLFFTVLGVESAKVTEKVIHDSSSFLRNHLFKMLRVHTLPRLHFVFDESLERAMELSVLISAANQTHTSDDDEQP